MAEPRPIRTLPANPSLEHHRKLAKDLLTAYRSGDSEAAKRIALHLPSVAGTTHPPARSAEFTLSDAQFVLAREHGFADWPSFRHHVVERARLYKKAARALLDFGTPEPLVNHRSGTVADAAAVLQGEPDLAGADIYTAALLGSAEAVRAHLIRNPALSNAKGGPRNWEPLLYLCFSRFLRADPVRSAEFTEAAALLLQYGADPLAWFDCNGEHESALYGAAGVAHCAQLTRLLLQAGADPSDDEVIYHSCEAPTMDCMRELVAHGHNLNERGTALLRRLDFHDLAGVTWLLEAGARPDAGLDNWGKTALHQAVMRGCRTEFFPVILQYGADPNAVSRAGQSVYALAMRRGRSDVARLLLDAGVRNYLNTVDRFLSACALADGDGARAILAANPGLMAELSAEDKQIVCEMASDGKTAALVLLLDLEFPIGSVEPNQPTPLHQAACNGRISAVKLLLERGAEVDAGAWGNRSTPLDWVVQSSLDRPDPDGNYPIIARMLVEAGARLSERRKRG